MEAYYWTKRKPTKAGFYWCLMAEVVAPSVNYIDQTGVYGRSIDPYEAPLLDGMWYLVPALPEPPLPDEP